MIEPHTTLAVALEQIERFKFRALATEDAELRRWYIQTVDALIFDLSATGVISKERAAEMAQAWVHRYAAGLPNAPTITAEFSHAHH